MSRIVPSSVVLSAALVFESLSGATAHETAKGPNGGAIVDIAGHHVEFVPSATLITFHLWGEADAPIASSGAKVKAIVQDSGKTAQIEVAPVEPNKLIGKLGGPLTPGAKVVLTGTLSDGHGLQAKFTMP